MIEFISTHEDGDVTYVTTQALTLDEIFLRFEEFLRGAGFCFDGHIDIVEEQDGQ